MYRKSRTIVIDTAPPSPPSPTTAVASSCVSPSSREHQSTTTKKCSSLVDSYWLTRIVFLRFLGFIYSIAFLVALQQNAGLLGEDGLTPATTYLSMIRKQLGVTTVSFDSFMQVPTLFWFYEPNTFNLSITALLGAVISAYLVIFGAANVPMMAALWVLYMSIVNLGQTWYSFGWESQLLETGFLGIFMVPVLSLTRFPSLTPTPLVVIWGYRWLLFRIMLGAGLIKVRGDACWRDLTCMQYHYETQPVPNPISPFFHATPSKLPRTALLLPLLQPQEPFKASMNSTAYHQSCLDRIPSPDRGLSHV